MWLVAHDEVEDDGNVAKWWKSNKDMNRKNKQTNK